MEKKGFGVERELAREPQRKAGSTDKAIELAARELTASRHGNRPVDLQISWGEDPGHCDL